MLIYTSAIIICSKWIIFDNILILAKKPKLDNLVRIASLVSNLLLLSQEGRLKIASGLAEAKTLVAELQNMRVKIDLKTAHDSYGAWREGQHDDLVLAVALAAWWGENKPRPPIITRAIRTSY